MAAPRGRGARARVLDQLRDAIVRGEHPPGTSLSEGALAEAYGTSRTPIREALQQLQSEGLVEVVPRVGTFVRQPSRREVVELFQLKSVLEGLGAQLLAQRGRVAETELLQANLADSEAAVQAGDMERYAQLVHEFHGLIVQGADNHRLAAHYSSLMNQLAYHRIVVTTLRHPGRLAASLDEHRRVLDRIVDKDGFGAEAAMRDHVRSSEREAMTEQQEE
ncbi:GntR family transcriptional regulator [Saccharopolyspora rosea]|uniref:GntR family transcriptional regulator n=1 Tax=Saccharopolyspora rosea TaxID=524884 RepID=A0ABW3G4Q7_9PSEU|nr:GntR family transcriptional regulator [Saccharopolyspora rosea]